MMCAGCDNPECICDLDDRLDDWSGFDPDEFEPEPEPEAEAEPAVDIRSAFWDEAPCEVIAAIVSMLDAKHLGRLLCVSRYFAKLELEAQDGTQVVLAEFIRPRKRLEEACAEVRRAVELRTAATEFISMDCGWAVLGPVWTRCLYCARQAGQPCPSRGANTCTRPADSLLA